MYDDDFGVIIVIIAAVVIALVAGFALAGGFHHQPNTACKTSNGNGGVILSCTGNNVTVYENGAMYPYYYPMYIPYNDWHYTSVYVDSPSSYRYASSSGGSGYVGDSESAVPSEDNLEAVPIEESQSVEEFAGLPEDTDVSVISDSEMASGDEAGMAEGGESGDAGGDAGGDGGGGD